MSIHNVMDLTESDDDEEISFLPPPPLQKIPGANSAARSSSSSGGNSSSTFGVYGGAQEGKGASSIDRFLREQLNTGKLTEEEIRFQHREVAQYAEQKHRRAMPGSIPGSVHAHGRVGGGGAGLHAPSQHQHQHNQNTQSLHNRPLVAVVPGGSQPQYAHQQQFAHQQYYLPHATVVFTLISLERFSIQSDGHGKFERAQLMFEKLMRIDGFEFNATKQRVTFPLASYPAVEGTLSNLKLIIQGVERDVISRATLRLEQKRNGTKEDKAEEERIDTLLREEYHLSDKLMEALAPFQKKTVEFVCKKNNGRAMIADDMGLGKTRQAIACAAVFRNEWPCLIVCPSSARFHWKFELIQLQDDVSPKDITVVESKTHPLGRRDKQRKYQFVIISYNLIKTMYDQLRGMEFGVVICDECHYLKNSKAQRTKALTDLMKYIPRIMMLSGTPALSRPSELFNILHILDPRGWPSSSAFTARYCRAKKKKGRKLKAGQEYKGASNTHELHIILTDTIMIRRLKTEILKELPPKHREIAQVAVLDDDEREELRTMFEEIKEREANAAAFKRLKQEQKRSGGGGAQKMMRVGNTLVPVASPPPVPAAAGEDGTTPAEERKERMNLLMSLFRRSGLAKVPAMLTHLTTFLDDPSSGKVLVFAHHTAVLNAVSKFCEDRGEEYIRIDGSTGAEERLNLAQKLQKQSRVRVAVLAITAAGISLTLTAAATVYFAEMYWTPGSLLQAEDRAHRIGQTNTVRIKYFLASGTVDELLWPLVRDKMKTLGEICEGRIVDNFRAANLVSVEDGGVQWDTLSRKEHEKGEEKEKKKEKEKEKGVASSSCKRGGGEQEEEDEDEEVIIDRDLVEDIVGSQGGGAEEDDDVEEDDEEDRPASRSSSAANAPEDEGEGGGGGVDEPDSDEEEAEPDHIAILYHQLLPKLQSAYDPEKIKSMDSGFAEYDDGTGSGGIAGSSSSSSSSSSGGNNRPITDLTGEGSSLTGGGMKPEVVQHARLNQPISLLDDSSEDDKEDDKEEEEKEGGQGQLKAESAVDGNGAGFVDIDASTGADAGQQQMESEEVNK